MTPLPVLPSPPRAPLPALASALIEAPSGFAYSVLSRSKDARVLQLLLCLCGVPSGAGSGGCGGATVRGGSTALEAGPAAAVVVLATGSSGRLSRGGADSRGGVAGGVLDTGGGASGRGVAGGTCCAGGSAGDCSVGGSSSTGCSSSTGGSTSISGSAGLARASHTLFERIGVGLGGVHSRRPLVPLRRRLLRIGRRREQRDQGEEAQALPWVQLAETV